MYIMGIDFEINGKTIMGCRYGTWNDIRKEIMSSVYKYILSNYSDSNPDVDNAVDKNQLEKTINMISDTMKMRHHVQNFVQCCDNWKPYIDTLNSIRLGGLYALCAKSDTEGTYTFGNSCDICELLDNVKPFVRTSRDSDDSDDSEDSYIDFWSMIYGEDGGVCFYDLFSKSKNEGLPINIF